MTTAEILARAADLIEPEGAWIRHDSAQTVGGHPINARNPDAVRFCALGALAHVAGANGPFNEAYDLLRKSSKHNFISRWNDEEATQQEVVAALRLASARAKEEK